MGKNRKLELKEGDREFDGNLSGIFGEKSVSKQIGGEKREKLV